MAFARLLLHRPGLAFLDEATGAVDSETEALLYRALQNQLSSYISIGEFQPCWEALHCKLESIIILLSFAAWQDIWHSPRCVNL